MAQLTWKNVDAPDFQSSTASLRVMGDMLNKGFEAGQKAIGDFQDSRMQSESAKLMMDIQKYQDPASVKQALASGTAFAGLDPRYINAEALKFVENRADNLLREDSTYLQNQASRQTYNFNEASNPLKLEEARQINTKRGLETEQYKVLTERNNREYGALGAANEAVARVNGMLQSKDPAQIEQAQKIMASPEFAGALTATGLKVDDINKITTSAPSVVEGGLKLANTLKERDLSLKAEKTYHDLVGSGISFPDMVSRVQGLAAEQPEVAAKVMETLTKNKGLLDAEVDANEFKTREILRNGGKTGAPTLFGLTGKHEAGSYDTLYGNAERKGPFAGIKVSNMTVGQASAFADPNGPYAAHVRAQVGRTATPMGRFQIVGDTLRGAIKEMGLDPNTPFNEETQNRIFVHLAQKRLSGPQSMAGKMANLRQEWEGFKNVPDQELAAAIVQFENGNPGLLSNVAQGGGANNAERVISAVAGSGSGNRPSTSTDVLTSDALTASRPGPVGNSPLDIIERASEPLKLATTTLNQSIADKAFDTSSPVHEALIKGPDGKSKAEASAELFKKIGGDKDAPWYDEGLSQEALRSGVDYIADKFKIALNIAAAMVENAVKTNGNWFRKDTGYVDKDVLDTVAREYFDDSGKVKEGALQNATAQVRGRQMKEETEKLIQDEIKLLKEEQQKYMKQVTASRNGNTRVNLDAARERFEKVSASVNKTLQKYAGSEAINLFERGRRSQMDKYVPRSNNAATGPRPVDAALQAAAAAGTSPLADMARPEGGPRVILPKIDPELRYR